MYRLLFAVICIVLIPSFARAETLLESGQYFEGTWTCKTERGSFAVHNYRIELGDRWLTMHNRFEMTDGSVGLYDEYYRSVPLLQRWDAVVFGSDGSLATGTSPGWSGDAWIFTGTVSVGVYKYPWRMTYTKQGVAKFERVHELQIGSEWKRNAGETCEKRQ